MAPTSLAACRAFSTRRTEARMLSATINNPITLDRPKPALVLPAVENDPRPVAESRSPCPRCETRGDFGCRHQRPYIPLEPVGYSKNATRWDWRRSPRDSE
jgi:hypothetical protein